MRVSLERPEAPGRPVLTNMTSASLWALLEIFFSILEFGTNGFGEILM